MPGGARRLTVRTKLAAGSNVRVEVHDTGTGIIPDQLESIFDPFVTSKRDGLGMGLSICRSIVERHGGRIWAANNPDRGATLSVTLPLTAAGPDRVPQATPGNPDGAALRPQRV